MAHLDNFIAACWDLLRQLGTTEVLCSEVVQAGYGAAVECLEVQAHDHYPLTVDNITHRLVIKTIKKSLHFTLIGMDSFFSAKGMWRQCFAENEPCWQTLLPLFQCPWPPWFSFLPGNEGQGHSQHPCGKNILCHHYPVRCTCNIWWSLTLVILTFVVLVQASKLHYLES